MLTIDRLIFIGAILGFCGLTVVDGARNPIVHLIYSSYFLVLLALWILICSRILLQHRVHHEFRWVWVAWAAWLTMSWLQASEVAGFGSVDPYLSWLKLYLYTGYFAALALFAVLLRTRSRILVLVGVIVVIAISQAVFGMINYYSKLPVFGWVPTHYAFIRVTGTFINRNFFANIIAMSSSFVLVWIIISSGSRGARGRQSGYSRPDHIHGVKLALGLILIILLAGLLLSGSRAAIVSYVAALVLLLILVSMDSRITSNFKILILIAPVVIVFFGAKLIRHRMVDLLIQSGERLQQWKLTLQMIRDAPFFGRGPGTYETVFRTRKGEGLGPLTYNNAHNDYLELLIEQGIVGLLLPGIILAIIAYKALSRMFATRNIFRKKLILSCLFGITAILVHAMMDFPFQIPANVWLYILLLAIMMNATIIKLKPKFPD